MFMIHKKLSSIHWTRSLHKTPTKARIIITTPNCSVKLLSEAVLDALNLIYKEIENSEKK